MNVHRDNYACLYLNRDVKYRQCNRQRRVWDPHSCVWVSRSPPQGRPGQRSLGTEGVCAGHRLIHGTPWDSGKNAKEASRLDTARMTGTNVSPSYKPGGFSKPYPKTVLTLSQTDSRKGSSHFKKHKSNTSNPQPDRVKSTRPHVFP